MSRLATITLVLSACLNPQKIAAQTPQISPGTVVNAASYAQPGVVAPGMVFAIFGTSLTDGTSAAAPDTSSLPTRLAGARVLVNGTAAPLLYASPGAIDAQFPPDLTALTSASLQVEVQSAVGTVTSPAITVSVVPFSPGIFTLNQSGSGPGVITRASDFNTICPPARNACTANPALPGEVVSVYMTGLGAAGSPVPVVTVGGTQASVLFTGPVKAVAGLQQVDVLLPGTLSPGDNVPLGVSVGSAVSNQVTISIGPAPPSAQGPAQPPGGGVTAIAVDPVHHYTVYAATSKGVFKSAKGGATWSEANNGLPLAAVSVIAVDPSNPAIVYAGIRESGAYDGVYKSIDGGAGWAAARSGVAKGISSLVIAPSRPGTLYASTNADGILKSADGGATWIFASNGMRPPGTVFSDVSALVVDPMNADVAYAATTGGGAGPGVWKTTDGGDNWSITSLSGTGPVFALALDPQNSATLYAGTSTGVFNGGVFRSTDRGTTWTETDSGITSSFTSISALAVNPANSSLIYTAVRGRGVFKSADSGSNWTPVDSAIVNAGPSALAIDPVAPGTLYAATGSGIFKSVDGGASWIISPLVVTRPTVSALVIDPANPGTIYVGILGRGVFRSTDGAATWTAASNGLTSGSVDILAIDPLHSTTIYAGTGLNVLKSVDGGQNWGRLNFPVPALRSLAVDPRNPAVLYAGTSYVGRSSVLFKSSDGGESWNPLSAITLAGVQALAIDPFNSSTVYAGGPSGPPRPNAFLAKSTTAGASWTALDGTPQPLAALLIDPRNTSTVYARTTAGIILKSTNGGADWNYTGNGTPPVNAMAVDPSNPSTLYIGGQAGSVFRSTNGGASWTLANTGLTSSPWVIQLAVDPSNSGTVYAGTFASGIFKSTDSGASWQPTGPN